MNRKTKLALLLCILGMAIGFAAVSTVLYLTGNTNIASNTGDFDVYYSKAVENGVENASIIKDKTHLEFTTELTGVDDKYVLDYDVTNASKQYDANLVMNCVGGNEYLRVENKFDTSKVLPARTTRSGRLTLTVIKAPLTEMSVSITCEISGNAVEKEVVGGDNIGIEMYDCLVSMYGSNHPTPETYDPYLGYDLDRSKVETITIVASKEIPEGATLIGDVSNNQNGSIMMYSKDEDSDNMLELYIGQDGGVVANPDSTGLFAIFNNLISINGLENLDTSKVRNMYGMFYRCYTLTTLNVSHFDTSNATDMTYMFSGCGSLTGLDISHFDTSNVTRMVGMFAGCGNLPSLDVSGFDTSNATDMSYMFSNCSSLASLYVSEWDTSSVTNMSGVFYRCENLTSLDLSKWSTNLVTSMEEMFCECSSLTSLDVSTWDTSNVTNMRKTFYYCRELKELNLSSWDIGNVTNMQYMFSSSPKLSTTIMIGLTNCTDYLEMFSYASTTDGAQITVNYTENTSDLVDKMIATKSSNSNIVKGNLILTAPITIQGNDNVTANYTKGYEGQTITLSPTGENDGVISFKMNGTLITGNKFKMPNKEAIITDITVKQIIFGITIRENADVTTDYSKAYKGDTITLSYKDDTKAVTSFKMNGTLITGDTFTMPGEEAIITEVVLKPTIFDITVNGNDSIFLINKKARKGKTIVLYASEATAEETRVITSFKMNGTLVIGDSFIMPEENVVITDVVVKDATIIESEHRPYPGNLDDKVYGEQTFDGATSLTVILEYQTDDKNHNWIYLYDSTGKQYGKYASTRYDKNWGIRKRETITIPGNYIKITFTTGDDGPYYYYGFKAAIVPNYE